MTLAKQLPLDGNLNAVQAAHFPAAGDTVTVTANGAVPLPSAGLYRVLASGSGCAVNGMPLAVGVFEYFYWDGTTPLNATVGAGANIAFTRVG